MHEIKIVIAESITVLYSQNLSQYLETFFLSLILYAGRVVKSNHPNKALVNTLIVIFNTHFGCHDISNIE